MKKIISLIVIVSVLFVFCSLAQSKDFGLSCGEIAPAESILLAKKLKGSPEDFAGKQIRLHCAFYEVSSGTKAMSAPIYYDVGLTVHVRTSEKELLGIIFMNVSVPKQKADIVYSLNKHEPITIFANVLYCEGCPTGVWIRAYDIKKGWK